MSETQYADLFKSSDDQGAVTPSGLLKQIREAFLPDGEELFDPCPRGWSRESGWDALDPGREWGRYNFVNPPFCETEKFFDKAVAVQDRSASCFLVPCRFHTHFFFRIIPHIRKIVLMTSGVAFAGYKRTLPVSLCLVVFGPDHLVQRCPMMAEDFGSLSFVKFPMETTVAEAAEYGPEGTKIIHGALSEPLRLIHRYADPKEPLSVLMPSRLENMVIRDTTMAKRNVKMVFIFPVLRQEKNDKSRLMNGSMFAFHNEAMENHRLKKEWMMHKPYDIIDPCNTHDDAEYRGLLRAPY